MVNEPTWVTPSGSIATITEGDLFSFALQYNNPLIGLPNFEIIAGELPNGLTLDVNGVISGTANNVPVPSEYNFTIRLTNAQGFEDRTFSLAIADIIPSWLDPVNMGSIPYYSIFEYQFFVLDPGFSEQSFIKIGGELPAGVFLNSSGRLFGLLDLVDSDTIYTFTIRALLDGTKFEDRTFQITVTTSGNRPPIWNTPAGLIGNIQGSVPFSFQFSAGDPDSDTITYSAIGLPPGFSLNAAGLLSGTLPDATPAIYTFSVMATDGFSNTSRTFKLNANDQVEFPIEWITPEGLIGEIYEGDKSLLGVKAESDSLWLRYELTAGGLPPGLTLDTNTGDIWGLAEEQGADTTYSFTIKAFNSSVEISGNFEINIIDRYVTGTTRSYVALYGPDWEPWYDLFTSNEIGIDTWFRQGDDQFGLVERPEILLVENLNPVTADQVADALQDVRRTYFNVGSIKVARAVDPTTNEFAYEVLYRTLYDDSAGSQEEFQVPQTGQTVKPGALEHLRNRLIDNFGSSGGTDVLPLWMSSEQILGDNTSVIGWIPALVFAYVKPGTGQAIADSLNSMNQEQEKLYLRRVRVDRLLIEPAADNSFEPVPILFDNEH